MTRHHHRVAIEIACLLFYHHHLFDEQHLLTGIAEGVYRQTCSRIRYDDCTKSMSPKHNLTSATDVMSRGRSPLSQHRQCCTPARATPWSTTSIHIISAGCCALASSPRGNKNYAGQAVLCLRVKLRATLPAMLAEPVRPVTLDRALYRCPRLVLRPPIPTPCKTGDHASHGCL